MTPIDKPRWTEGFHSVNGGAPRIMYEYYVTGRGRFPYDMLRWDQCWPTDDVEKLEPARSVEPVPGAPRELIKPRSIRMRSFMKPTRRSLVELPVELRHRKARLMLWSIAQWGAMAWIILSSAVGGYAIFIALAGLKDHDGWTVWCRDDTLSDGTPGPYVRATRKVFPTRDAARAYSLKIAQARKPVILKAPKP
jgi:hypothetical protein